MSRRRRGLFVAPLSFLAMCGSLAGAAVILTMSSVAGPALTQVAIQHPLLSIAAPRTAFHMSQSNNWSGYNQGYLEKSTLFQSISAQWTVPTATQHKPGEAENSATWIGIGGGCLDAACTLTDNTLIQAGTEQDVASDGTASYSAWWEIIPVPVVPASITVHPGDSISCTIAQSVPEVWTITLNDLSDGQGFSQTVPYPSTLLTAEWVLETPVVVSTSATSDHRPAQPDHDPLLVGHRQWRQRRSVGGRRAPADRLERFSPGHAVGAQPGGQRVQRLRPRHQLSRSHQLSPSRPSR
jgi:hypothetical protein